MGSNDPSAFHNQCTDDSDQNPFTSTNFDFFPPPPILPPDNLPQLAEYLNDNMVSVSSYAQLKQENDRIKAEIVAVHAERLAEQRAYKNFIKSAQGLPDKVQTPAMRLAIRQLFEASHVYQPEAVKLNQRFQQMKDLLPASSPRQNIIFNTGSAIGPPETPSGLRKTSMASSAPVFPPPGLNIKAQHRAAIATIKATLTHLGISRPARSQPFVSALDHFKNNANSFIVFTVLYLNGRYKHVTGKIRPQVTEIIGTFFDDAEDAKLVVNDIMKALRENVKYGEQDVQGICGDIIAPVGMMLWALIDLLEGEQR